MVADKESLIIQLKEEKARLEVRIKELERIIKGLEEIRAKL